MTSSTTAVDPGAVRKEPAAEEAAPAKRSRSIPRAGWTIIAAKEFGDHVLSSRFLVLAIIMAVAAAVPGESGYSRRSGAAAGRWGAFGGRPSSGTSRGSGNLLLHS